MHLQMASLTTITKCSGNQIIQLRETLTSVLVLLLLITHLVTSVHVNETKRSPIYYFFNILKALVYGQNVSQHTIKNASPLLVTCVQP